jgi:hypothetical protein
VPSPNHEQAVWAVYILGVCAEINAAARLLIKSPLREQPWRQNS